MVAYISSSSSSSFSYLFFIFIFTIKQLDPSTKSLVVVPHTQKLWDSLPDIEKNFKSSLLSGPGIGAGGIQLDYIMVCLFFFLFLNSNFSQ